jgi:hypothetical protein
MTSIYRPLGDGEIRLLSFEKHQPESTEDKPLPIVCTIEHVLLPSTEKLPQCSLFKGNDYVWPELSTSYDPNILFQDGQDPYVDRNSNPSAAENVGLDGETSLSWRFKWGDFIALSYAWRPATPRHSITVNGVPLEITHNLYDALVQLRRCQRIRQGFKLWIDAICINQDDLTERARQVTRMRDIYQSAWQVAVWIGAEADESPTAITALRWFAQRSHLLDPLEGFYQERKMIDARPLFISLPSYKSPLRSSVFNALFHFFSRAYWQRMWIIQEIAAGKGNTPVMCGKDCIPWSDLYQASQVITRDAARLGRDILHSNQQLVRPTWAFHFAQDRQPDERRFSSERLWKIQDTLMEIQQSQRSKSSASNWHKLVRALTLVRDASVTEERDRVYGILGIKAVADSLVWKNEPDYMISLEELYQSFTSGFLAAGNLSILRLVSRCAAPSSKGHKTVKDLPPRFKRGNDSTVARLGAAVALWAVNATLGPGDSPEAGTRCIHEIPSWTICWTCDPAPTSQLGGMYQADACLGHSPPVSIVGTSSLMVKGIVLDTIVSLSACNESEADARYPLNSEETNQSMNNIYGDYEATKNAFWRTIVGDTTSKGGEKAPESYSWLLHERLWQRGIAGAWTYGFGLHNFMRRNQNLQLCGYTLEELIFGCNKMVSRLKMIAGDNYYNPTEAQREAVSWAINATAWRRIFATKDGRMGMGSCAAEVGDRIVILRGCNTPMILREVGKEWKLIGECYTHGVMYGEASGTEDELVDIIIR